MKKGLLSWWERWGSSKKEIWGRNSASFQMCHTHFTEKMLWKTYFWPSESVPWQPWQKGTFMLPAKALALGASLGVSAPGPFSIPSPRGFRLCSSHYISSLLLAGPGPDFLSTVSSWDAHMGGLLWEAPALALPVSHLAPHLSIYFIWRLTCLVTHCKPKLRWQGGDWVVPCWHGKGQSLQSCGVDTKAPSACRWLVCPGQQPLGVQQGEVFIPGADESALKGSVILILEWELFACRSANSLRDEDFPVSCVDLQGVWGRQEGFSEEEEEVWEARRRGERRKMNDSCRYWIPILYSSCTFTERIRQSPSVLGLFILIANT